MDASDVDTVAKFDRGLSIMQGHTPCDYESQLCSFADAVRHLEVICTRTIGLECLHKELLPSLELRSPCLTTISMEEQVISRRWARFSGMLLAPMVECSAFEHANGAFLHPTSVSSAISVQNMLFQAYNCGYHSQICTSVSACVLQ